MGRILVVDDTLFMRTLLKNILFSGGHTIVGGLRTAMTPSQNIRNRIPTGYAGP